MQTALKKFDLMIIGKAKHPRAFRTKAGKELGFDYYSNKTAWMRTELFFLVKKIWFLHWKTPGRNAFLLVDNCEAHGKPETLPELDNVDVMFLSKNTTSKIQPLDAGIIAAMKRQYRKRHIDNVEDIARLSSVHVYGWIRLLACWEYGTYSVFIVWLLLLRNNYAYELPGQGQSRRNEFATSACSEKGSVNPPFVFHFVRKGITFLSIVPPHLVNTQRSPLAGGENPYLVCSRGQNQSAILRLADTVEPSPGKQLSVLAN